MIFFTRLGLKNFQSAPFVTKKDNKTIEHLYVDCYCVKELWELCEKWLLRKFERHVKFVNINSF